MDRRRDVAEIAEILGERARDDPGERLVRRPRGSSDRLRVTASDSTGAGLGVTKLRDGVPRRAARDGRCGNAPRGTRGVRAPQRARAVRSMRRSDSARDAARQSVEAAERRRHRRAARAGDRGSSRRVAAARRCARDRRGSRPRLRGAHEGALRRRQARFADGARDALAEHESLQQRIAGEAIAAVQARRGHFAAGPEAGQRRRAARIRRDAAHVEMRRRRHRQRAGALGSIPAARAMAQAPGKRASSSGITVTSSRPRGRRARRAATLRATTSRGASSASGWIAGMKRCRVVEQHGACAAQRLGQEGQGIAADGERGRVELHEFEVGKAHAAARGGGEAGAARSRGIGRVARSRRRCRRSRARHAARARRDGARPGAASSTPATRAPAVMRSTSSKPSSRRISGPLQGGRAQGVHDGGAGAVAARVDDAMAAVAGFAAEQRRAVRTEVEGDAEVAQPVDARCRRLGHERDDVGLAQARHRTANRVGGMQGRGVVAADRGGDAALREARRSVADRAVRDEHAAVERERGRKARDAAADDDGRRRMKSSTITA